jgi:hypothetical protein
MCLCTEIPNCTFPLCVREAYFLYSGAKGASLSLKRGKNRLTRSRTRKPISSTCFGERCCAPTRHRASLRNVPNHGAGLSTGALPWRARIRPGP